MIGASFYKNYEWLALIAIVITIVILIALVCSKDLAMKVPINYILLTIFTSAEGFSVGFICSTYTPDSVALALFISAIIVISLTIYAMITKTDYTIYGGILVVLLIGLIGFSILCMFVQNTFMNKLYAACGAILFGFYLIFDVQMAMKKYSIDEYILAAISIYLDIINIFIKILQLIGKKK